MDHAERPRNVRRIVGPAADAARASTGLRWRGTTLLASMVIALASIARGEAASPSASDATATVDRAAVAAIVMSSVSEMQLCRFALEKTQNPEVKSFCRSAVSDSERNALAGMQLAQTLGASEVKLAPSPDTPDVLDALTQYAGHAFDRTFLLTQIVDHENDEDSLRYASATAANGAVKRYEESVLPKVEKDLELAESALRTISGDEP